MENLLAASDFGAALESLSLQDLQDILELHGRPRQGSLRTLRMNVRQLALITRDRLGATRDLNRSLGIADQAASTQNRNSESFEVDTSDFRGNGNLPARSTSRFSAPPISTLQTSIRNGDSNQFILSSVSEENRGFFRININSRVEAYNEILQDIINPI